MQFKGHYAVQRSLCMHNSEYSLLGSTLFYCSGRRMFTAGPIYSGFQSKQSGPFQACNLSVKLGEVAVFGTCTCIQFVAERPETVSWKAISCNVY